MKLYVKSRSSDKKHYLRDIAATRQEFARKIGGKRFKVGDEVFSVGDVTAERKLDNTAVAMAVGGVIGIVGGPVGVAAGTIIGGLLGNGADKKEVEEIESFNRSRL